MPSFPCYEVSESGDVRRCKPGIRGGEVGKVMKPYVREDGYRMYILRHENCSYHRKAHQLVIEAFVGPKPFPNAEVRHMDGTRTNDHFTNLQWGTSAENKADMLLHNTRMRGETAPQAKLSLAQVLEIRALAEKGCVLRDLGRRFGVGANQISGIVRKTRWAHA